MNDSESIKNNREIQGRYDMKIKKICRYIVLILSVSLLTSPQILTFAQEEMVEKIEGAVVSSEDDIETEAETNISDLIDKEVQVNEHKSTENLNSPINYHQINLHSRFNSFTVLDQNGQKFPEGSKFILLGDFNDLNSYPFGMYLDSNTGEFNLHISNRDVDIRAEIPVAVTTPDGFETKVVVVVEGKKPQTDAERYTPFYGMHGSYRGEAVVLIIDNYGEEFPVGTTFKGDNPLFDVNPNTGEASITIPEDAPFESTISTNVTISYPDGSQERIVASTTIRLAIEVSVLVEETNLPAKYLKIGVFNSDGEQSIPILSDYIGESGKVNLYLTENGNYSIKVMHPGIYFNTDKSEIDINIPNSFPDAQTSTTLYVSNQIPSGTKLVEVQVGVFFEDTFNFLNIPVMGATVHQINGQREFVSQAKTDASGVARFMVPVDKSYIFSVHDVESGYQIDEFSAKEHFIKSDELDGSYNTVNLYVFKKETSEENIGTSPEVSMNSKDETDPLDKITLEESFTVEAISKVNDVSDSKTSESGEKPIENRPDDETSKNGESTSEETSKTEETSKVNDVSDSKTSESGEKSIENRTEVKPVAVPTKQSPATNGESLPNTGEGSQFMVFLGAFVSVFAGLGLLVRHGKKVS